MRDSEQGVVSEPATPAASYGRTLEVRPVVSGEGALLRELRLRALRDAPKAFAAAIDVEMARPDSHWRDLADASGSAGDGRVLVAVRGRRWIAMAASRWFDRPAGIAQLWGMWVEPEARGRGLGRILVDAVASWASEQGAVMLRLGVTEPAAEVAHFYEHLGFRRTGETKLLPPDGAVRAFFLARPLWREPIHPDSAAVRARSTRIAEGTSE
jgi:GNAT superfamily N-acetyltransferase